VANGNITQLISPLIPISTSQTGTEGAYNRIGKVIVFYAKCVKPNASYTMFYLPAPKGLNGSPTNAASLGSLLSDDGLSVGMPLIITGAGQVQLRTGTFTEPKYIFGAYIAE